jgi:hypothetical protein
VAGSVAEASGTGLAERDSQAAAPASAIISGTTAQRAQPLDGGGAAAATCHGSVLGLAGAGVERGVGALVTASGSPDGREPYVMGVVPAPRTASGAGSVGGVRRWPAVRESRTGSWP